MTTALRSIDIGVTTVDVQPELQPDYVSSVTDMPFQDGQFDVALCCQVLEHLPFDQFRPALSELRRVTRLGVVLSLPDVDRHGFMIMKLPFIRRLHFKWNLPVLKRRSMPCSSFDESGHYWEIGYAGYPLRRIESAIDEAGFNIKKHWRVPELPWHRFFCLQI